MKNFGLIFILLTSQVIYCQSQWLNFTQNHEISDVLETDDGVWTASRGGLCFHNNETNETKYFNRGNSNIPSNQIHDLFDNGSEVWVTTSNGLCVIENDMIIRGPRHIRGIMRLNQNNKIVIANYDSIYVQTTGIQFETIAYPNYVAGVGGIEINSEGTIYLNAINFFAPTYVFAYKDGQWDTLYEKYIYETSLTMDQNERVWFLNPDGLQYLDDNSWVNVLPKDSLNMNVSNRITADMQGNIIIHKLNNVCQELLKWDGIQLSEINFAKDNCEDCRFIGISSKQEDLFFSSNIKHGLYTFSETIINDYTPLTQSPIAYNHTIATLHPSNGTHLIISYNRIQQIKNKKWTDIDLPATIQEQITHAGLDDSDRLWIMTKDKLFYLENASWTNVPLPASITENLDLMTIGNNGEVWVQSRLVIAKYNTVQWRTYNTSDHKISSSIIKDMVVNPENGALWVSTFQGIRRYDGFLWSKNELLKNNQTFNLAVNDDGVFVHAGNLFHVKANQVDTIHLPAGNYFGNFESEMYYEPQTEKLILVGTDVLAIYEAEEWTVYNTENSGMINGSVNHISVDQKGSIWLAGSNGGVSIFNKDGIFLSTLNPKPIDTDFEIAVYPTLVNKRSVFLNSSRTDDFEVIIYDSSGAVLKIDTVHLVKNDPHPYFLPKINSSVVIITVKNKNHLISKRLLILN